MKKRPNRANRRGEPFQVNSTRVCWVVWSEVQSINQFRFFTGTNAHGLYSDRQGAKLSISRKIRPLFLQHGLFGHLFQQRDQTNNVLNQKHQTYGSKKQNQPEHG